MSEWDNTPYAEHAGNASVTAGCLYCTITVDADGRILHEGGCVGVGIADLRASRLRLAKMLVLLRNEIPGSDALAEARRIVREEGP